MATMEAICRILKIGMPKISETYISAAPSDLDMRDKERLDTMCRAIYPGV